MVHTFEISEKSISELIPADGAFAILTRPVSESGKLYNVEIELGEALIVRKADGRASDDAIESLMLSHKLLGTKKWVIIHYIGDDASPVFDSEAMGELLKHSQFESDDQGLMLRNSRLDGSSDDQWQTAWTAFWQAASRNLAHEVQIIRDDIDRICNHPNIPPDVKVEGYIHDLKLGELIPV